VKLEKPFQPKPDFEYFRKVILREAGPGPVPIIELGLDPEIMSEAADVDFPAERYAELLNMLSGTGMDQEQALLGLKFLELCIAFHNHVGYDYSLTYPTFAIPMPGRHERDNPQQADKKRYWQEEHAGMIVSREGFDKFPWPEPGRVFVFPIDYAASKMRPGMKVLPFFMGIFEALRALMGYETLAIKSIEDPGLVEAILDKLGDYMVAAMDKVAGHPAAGAVFYAEDLGFNTGTMLSPRWMREYLIPHEKKIADACHKHGKPFLFHCCGKVDAIMDDLIEVVKIDARHSFQDNSYPVEEQYAKYHDRIAILGGLDVDLLARGTPAEVRAKTKRILECCAPGGGFCMGSGNSVTNFCKLENFYAMLDETRRWNEEHG